MKMLRNKNLAGPMCIKRSLVCAALAIGIEYVLCAHSPYVAAGVVHGAFRNDIDALLRYVQLRSENNAVCVSSYYLVRAASGSWWDSCLRATDTRPQC